MRPPGPPLTPFVVRRQPLPLVELCLEVERPLPHRGVHVCRRHGRHVGVIVSVHHGGGVGGVKRVSDLWQVDGDVVEGVDGVPGTVAQQHAAY